jgi:hypothetical protein
VRCSEGILLAVRAEYGFGASANDWLYQVRTFLGKRRDGLAAIISKCKLGGLQLLEILAGVARAISPIIAIGYQDREVNLHRTCSSHILISSRPASEQLTLRIKRRTRLVNYVKVLLDYPLAVSSTPIGCLTRRRQQLQGPRF